MTAFDVQTRSLRALRLRAFAPRALLYLLVLILCAVGLKAIIVKPTNAAPAQKLRVVTAGPDFAAMSFAEGFARAYLTWSAADPEARSKPWRRMCRSRWIPARA